MQVQVAWDHGGVGPYMCLDCIKVIFEGEGRAAQRQGTKPKLPVASRRRRCSSVARDSSDMTQVRALLSRSLGISMPARRHGAKISSALVVHY